MRAGLAREAERQGWRFDPGAGELPGRRRQPRWHAGRDDGQQPRRRSPTSPRAATRSTVEKSGYTTTKQEFTLAAGQSLPLSLTLSPVSVEVPRPEGGKSIEIGGTGEPPERRGADAGPDRVLDRGRRAPWRRPALALKFGLDVRDVNSQLDQYRRFMCPRRPTDVDELRHQRRGQRQPLTDDQRAKAHSLTDRRKPEISSCSGFLWVSRARSPSRGASCYTRATSRRRGPRVRPITGSGFSLPRRRHPEESLRNSSSDAGVPA